MSSTSRPLPPSTVFLLAVLPLLVTIGLAVSLGRITAPARPATAEVAAGQGHSEQAAVAVGDEVQRWSSLVRLGAGNEEVAELLRHPRRSGQTRPGVEAFLISLDQQVAAGRGEASVIDASGTLVAQVVAGRVTAAGQLGSDQSGRPFYAAASKTASGAVHQHRPYVSAYTRTWVISTSAPVVVAGRVLGMLQVESDLDMLRERLIRALPGGAVARLVESPSHVIVAETGRAVPEPAAERALDMQWLPRAGRLDTGRDEQVSTSAVQVPAGLGTWRAEVLGASDVPPGPWAQLSARFGWGSAGSSWLGLCLLVTVLATAGALRRGRGGEQGSESATGATGDAADTDGGRDEGTAGEQPQDPGETVTAVSVPGVPVVPAPRSGSGRGSRSAGTPRPRQRDRG